MTVSKEALLNDYEFDPSLVERIAFRKVKHTIAIVEPDPSWPQHFDLAKTRIETALGDTAVSINHVGSTSVPGLPAKESLTLTLRFKMSTMRHHTCKRLKMWDSTFC
ncbi:hypothetical protein NXS19_011225 [Fusarium pseudograminearum]|nr:hypothetical protein NXS19_011225 [Fusarium pseudograminearum]